MLVSCDSPVDLSSAVHDVPDGITVGIDVPSGMMDGRLKDLTQMEDGADWKFCHQAYSPDGSTSFSRKDDISVGTFKATLSESGRLHLEMLSCGGDGMSVSCFYDGFPQISDEYIWRWDE